MKTTCRNTFYKRVFTAPESSYRVLRCRSNTLKEHGIASSSNMKEELYINLFIKIWFCFCLGILQSLKCDFLTTLATCWLKKQIKNTHPPECASWPARSAQDDSGSSSLGSPQSGKKTTPNYYNTIKYYSVSLIYAFVSMSLVFIISWLCSWQQFCRNVN